MAKRLRVTFDKPEGAARVDEEGQAKPCAMGVHWVNADTLRTLAKRRIARTDAKGRPLPPGGANPKATPPTADRRFAALAGADTKKAS